MTFSYPPPPRPNQPVPLRSCWSCSIGVVYVVVACLFYICNCLHRQIFMDVVKWTNVGLFCCRFQWNKKPICNRVDCRRTEKNKNPKTPQKVKQNVFLSRQNKTKCRISRESYQSRTYPSGSTQQATWSDLFDFVLIVALKKRISSKIFNLSWYVWKKHTPFNGNCKALWTAGWTRPEQNYMLLLLLSLLLCVSAKPPQHQTEWRSQTKLDTALLDDLARLSVYSEGHVVPPSSTQSPPSPHCLNANPFGKNSSPTAPLISGRSLA